MQPSERVQGFKEAAVHEMLARGQQLQATGRDVVYMVQGEPDFVTPDCIQAARGGNTHYTPAPGLKALRQRLAEHVAARNHLPVTGPDEIIVTTGAAQGLFIAAMALFEAGDEVILLEPGYVSTYAKTIKMAGGQSVVVQCPYDGRRFPLDLEAIEAVVTPCTRAIVLNTPVNPTASVYTRAELEALAKLVLRRAPIVISDEVYEMLVFADHEHVSFGSLGREIFDRTISVFTCSKIYAMTGWRVGYNVAGRDVVRWMSAVHTVSARCAANPVQMALLAALSDGVEEAVQAMHSAYARRRQIMIEGLSGVSAISPPAIEGTFYAFPRFGTGEIDSFRLAQQLLEEEAVVTTPGAYYGPGGESHLRLSFAYETPRIVEGLDRLRCFWARLHERGAVEALHR